MVNFEHLIRFICGIKDLYRIEFDEPNFEDVVSNFGEDDSESDDYYTPDRKKRIKKPETKRQLKPKKYKQSSRARSTVKKGKKSTESNPESTRRNAITEPADVWCSLCDTTFKKHPTYLKHMRQKHSPEVLSYVCAECPKAFASEQKLSFHMACHRPDDQKKIHPCPECDKTFSTVDIVHVHVRTVHLGERPFVCEECGKKCSTKGSLKEHKLSHSEERPFKCTECMKCFKDSTGLKRHSTTHNTASFECVLCGRRLNTLRTLKNHMLVHSDEKRFKCQHCGNNFKRYKTLKVRNSNICIVL